MSDNSLCKKGIFEDIRQASIVSRFEVLKYLSGYKLLIFGIIVIATLALTTVALIIFPGDEGVNKGVYAVYLSFITLLALLGATLFTSTTLCSEFEERTALVLFTKPIKKSSIFLGKVFIAFVLNVVIFAVFYLIVVVMGLILKGDFTTDILTSFGYLVAYVFAVTGIAVMFSSLMKRSSSASILTFIFVLLVPNLILSVIMISQGAKDVSGYWYFLDVAASSITTSVSGTVSNGLRDVIVMLIWGLIPMIVGYLRFSRREL